MKAHEKLTRDRAAAARHEASAWVQRLAGALDEGTPDALDGYVGAVGEGWHAEDDRDTATHSARVGEWVARAEAAQEEARDTERSASERHSFALIDHTASRRRLGLDETAAELVGEDSPGRATRTNGAPPALTPSHALGSWVEPDAVGAGRRKHLLASALVACAVGGDIAAFWIVLARLFRGNNVIVAIGTIGFAAAAVGIAHLIGVQLRARRAGDRRAGPGLLSAALLAWFGLGIASFFARWQLGGWTSGASSSGQFSGGFGGSAGGFGSSASGPGTDLALLSAVTFVALYVACGVLAILVSYWTHNPELVAYRRTLSALNRARNDLSEQRAGLAAAGAVVASLRSEANRVDELRETLRHRTTTAVDQARIEARLFLAARMGRPTGLDAVLEGRSDPEDREQDHAL